MHGISCEVFPLSCVCCYRSKLLFQDGLRFRYFLNARVDLNKLLDHHINLSSYIMSMLKRSPHGWFFSSSRLYKSAVVTYWYHKHNSQVCAHTSFVFVYTRYWDVNEVYSVEDGSGRMIHCLSVANKTIRLIGIFFSFSSMDILISYDYIRVTPMVYFYSLMCCFTLLSCKILFCCLFFMLWIKISKEQLGSNLPIPFMMGRMLWDLLFFCWKVWHSFDLELII